MTLTDRLRDQARRLGFDLVGITDAEPTAHGDLYRSWLHREHHGEMRYLAREDAVLRREDTRRTMPSVKSIVVVGHPYFVEDPPGVPEDASRGVVARYARGPDYHDVVEKGLKSLLAWIREQVERPVDGRVYVDHGPILERELGQRAGLGWFGRNTMLIHPRRGSYFFLGCLLLDLELESDPPFGEDHCGTCTRCLPACPTGALLGRDDRGAPVMDARRCISYLTIEHRGPIARQLRPLMGNRIFGCDICQEVCPWNERFAAPMEGSPYVPGEGMGGPSLVALATMLLDMDEEAFRRHFRGSPIQRARRTGLLRNVCVALGNWGAEEGVEVLLRALRDPQPLVRGHAAWALGRIGSPAAFEAQSSRMEVEDDEWVRAEVAASLGL